MTSACSRVLAVALTTSVISVCLLEGIVESQVRFPNWNPRGSDEFTPSIVPTPNTKRNVPPPGSDRWKANLSTGPKRSENKGPKVLGTFNLPPSQPANNQFNAGDVLVPLFQGLQNAQQQQQYYQDDGRSYQQQPRRGYRSEPTYSQPNYTQAQVRTAAPQAAPRPAPVPPPLKLIEPHDNSVPLLVTVGNASLTREVGGELDRLMSEMVVRLEEHTEAFTLTDAARESFCAEYLTDDRDPVLANDLRHALIDLDPEAADILCKKLGLSRRAADEILPRVRYGAMLYELEKLVRSEDSVAKVDGFDRRLQSSLGDFNFDRTQREAVSATTASILETLRVRLALSDRAPAAPGAQVPAPQGVLPAILYPPISPAKQVYLLGNRVLAVGRAEPGAMVVAKAHALELLDLPRADGPSLADSTADAARRPVTTGSVIYCPPEMEMNVNYTVNGHAYTVEPGQSQALPAGTSWVIAFDRGNHKEARYTLGDGCYAFLVKDGALDIVTRKCEVKIENPSSVADFHFVIDDQHVTIGPGKTLALSSKYPIMLGFKPGTGDEVKYKKLWGGDYAVALDGATLWDIYAARKPTPADDQAPVAVNP